VILQVLATEDLAKGKTIGIDATTLEANAAKLHTQRDLRGSIPVMLIHRAVR